MAGARFDEPLDSSGDRRGSGASAQERPVRTCVGCRERAAKNQLLRVVASERESGLVLAPDPAGTAPGRGAYVHPRRGCLELAFRRRAFPRALRVQGGVAGDPLTDYVGRLEQHDRPQ